MTMFDWLYRPETTRHLEQLYGAPHTDKCAACARFLENSTLSIAEQVAVEDAHQAVAPYWLQVSPHLQACQAVRRWGSMPNRLFKQTSYDHSLTLPVVAVFVFKASGGVGPKDARWAAVKALIHDMAEGLMGDVLYPVKKHVRMKKVYKSLEEDFSVGALRQIPELGEELLAIFLEEDTLRGKLFSAVEYVDYVLYAYVQLEAGCPDKAMIANEPFRRILPALEKAATDSTAITSLLAERSDRMNRLMAEFPPDTYRPYGSSEVTLRDLEVLLSATQELFLEYAKAHGGIVPEDIKTRLSTLVSNIWP